MAPAPAPPVTPVDYSTKRIEPAWTPNRPPASLPLEKPRDARMLPQAPERGLDRVFARPVSMPVENPPVAVNVLPEPPVAEFESAGGPDGRVWMRGEAILWWLSGANVPPLVTEDVTGATPGVLGAPGTVVRFGGRDIFENPRIGARFTAGMWLDRDQTCGIEANFFFLAQSGNNFTLGSTDGSRAIGRPFLNVQTGLQDAQLVSFANGIIPLAGSVAVTPRSDFFGGELNYRHNLCFDCRRRWDFLIGYRALQLNESIDIQENLLPLGPLVVPGSSIFVHDRFATENQFHGLNLGLAREIRSGMWSFDVYGKVALGNLHSVVNIDGSTRLAIPGAGAANLRGGLLALPTNIGRYEDNRFVAIPELGVNVGVQVSQHVRLLGGYTLLVVPDVARAGEQIDLRVNPSFIQGGAIAPTGIPAPFPLFNRSDLWAQGLNLGLEVKY